MECKDMQKRLSAYLDKAVSPKQKKAIDAHLKQCKRCRHYFVDLQKAVGYMQQLDEVEPPKWLAQRVMAQVRREAEKQPGIVKRLFYPFYIKLPLEAIALILVAVGAVYIFKGMQPQVQLTRIPTEQKEMAPASARAPKKEAPAAMSKEKPAPTAGGDRLMYEKRVETQADRSMGKARTSARMAEQEAAAPAAPSAYRDETGSRDFLAPAAVSPQRAAESKTKEIHFLVTVKDLAHARRDIEETLRKLGGRAIQTTLLQDKTVIDARIDAKKVRKLTDQLHLIGEVQEKGVVMEAQEGDVEVRIDLEKTSR